MAPRLLENLWAPPEDGDSKFLQNFINPPLYKASYCWRLGSSPALLWESQISEVKLFLPCLWYFSKDIFYVSFGITGVCALVNTVPPSGKTLEGRNQSLWNGCIWMWSKRTHEDMGHIWCLVDLHVVYKTRWSVTWIWKLYFDVFTLKNTLAKSYFSANSVMQFHSKNVTKSTTAISGRLL